MDNAQGLQFRVTLDNLTPAMISALIDISDGYPFMPEPWITRALEDRGLIKPLWDMIPLYLYGRVLTAFGEAFVAWMREPREVPQQLELFD